MSTQNARPRFTGFPCQTLSEVEKATNGANPQGHIRWPDLPRGLAEPFCECFGGLTHPCRSDSHRTATNRAFISRPSWRRRLARRNASKVQATAGKAGGSRYGRPGIRGWKCGPQARSLLVGGRYGLGEMWTGAGMTLSRKEIRQVRCPYCHASPGRGCHFTGKGASKKMRNGQSHFERMQEAQRQELHGEPIIDEATA